MIIKTKTIKDIIKVVISNLLTLFTGILVGFILPKIVGVTDYGYYKTFTLYSSYVGLVHIGITDGIYLKYGGQKYDELEKEKEAFRLYHCVIFLLDFLVSVLLCLTSLFIDDGNIKFIIVALAVFLLFNNIVGHFQIISQITNRFNELAIKNIIQSILTGVLIIFIWLLNKHFSFDISYKGYTVAYIGIISIPAFYYILRYRVLVFGKRDSIFQNKTKIWILIKIGIPLLIANLCSTFILIIDRQFVNILFDTDTYAVYAFAYNMLTLITTALSAVSTVLYPTLKRSDEKTLTSNYSKMVEIILVLVFSCLIVYFPLCWFIPWFLPKYINSLQIFRIILPGLAISSAITIVMHNYYKTVGKETQFFVKSIVVLGLSIFANYFAYIIFETTTAISIASIMVMSIWYILIEEYFIRTYKIKWIKNFVYMILVSSSFYLITLWDVWWVTMLLYLVCFISLTLCFYFKDIGLLLKIMKRKDL